MGIQKGDRPKVGLEFTGLDQIFNKLTGFM